MQTERAGPSDDPSHPSGAPSSDRARELSTGQPSRVSTPFTADELRVRLKDLEQELRAKEGHLAIAKNKARQAAEHEEFLLREVAKASNDLLCEWAIHHFLLSSCPGTLG